MPYHPDARPRAVSRTDQSIDAGITLGVAVLILVGFATSYRTLLDLAATIGGYPRWLAPAVPLSFDLGIVVLSLKVTRSARDGRTTPALRVLVAALSTATVVANASAATTPAARILHAVPPAMFVICFESVIVTSRREALSQRGLLPSLLPRLRAAAWLLAPRATFLHWRQLTLADNREAPPAVPAGAVIPRSSGIPRAATSPGGLRNGHRHPHSEIRRQRDTHLRRVLASEPNITARALVDRLALEGHMVSLRTVQRLRAAAEHEIRSPGFDAARPSGVA